MAAILMVKNYKPSTKMYRKGVSLELREIVGKREWKHSLARIGSVNQRLLEAERKQFRREEKSVRVINAFYTDASITLDEKRIPLTV